MTNPFSGGAPAAHPPQGAAPQAPAGGFTLNPEAGTSPFTSGGFGQPVPQQQREQTMSAPPRLPAAPGGLFNPEGAGAAPVQPLPGTTAVTPEGVRDIAPNAPAPAAWRMGDPVNPRAGLGPAPGPYVASRAPVKLASGRETSEVPGMPTYPMPGPIRAFEVVRNRYGHYCLPHPDTGKNSAFVRATTVAKAVSESGGDGLEKWKDRKLISGLLKYPSLLEGLDVDLIGTDQEWKLKKAMAEIAESARIAAGSADGREFGTAVHAWSEAYDIGAVTFDEIPEPLQRHVGAYIYMLHRYGVVAIPEYVERIVYCPLSNAVGTVDRIFRLPDGRLVIGDIKTSAGIDNAWSSISAQLAQYATATHMLSADGERWEPMPQVDRHLGLVASIPHTPSDRGIYCDLIPLNLQPGITLIELAMAVREANSSRAKRAIALDPMVMDVVADEAVAAVRAGLPALPAVQQQEIAVSQERVEVANASMPTAAMPAGLDTSDPRVVEAVAAIDNAMTVEAVVPLWQDWWPDELVVHAQRRIAEIQAQAEANRKRQETRARNAQALAS